MYRDTNVVHDLVCPANGADAMADTCNGCNICVKECDFLKTYGNPGTIVRKHGADPDKWQTISFECSLCGLCSSVCPLDLDPAALFLDYRKKAVKKDRIVLSDYRGLLNYEKKGTSKKYSFYSLPEHCNSVFFPGCSMTGIRPDMTLKLYEYLKELDGSTGIVLDCCTKPSHDLGRQDYFNDMFVEMKSFLLEHAICTIIVACPSCHKIFKTYGKEFKIKTVYEILSGSGLNENRSVSGTITIHDPCQVRFEDRIQDSVRSIVKALGLEIIDTPHRGEKTFCCGEGGGVGCVSPGFAGGWTKKRVSEAHPHIIASYCAACVNRLSKHSASFHILDLVFNPERTMAGNAKVSKAPFTYLNRLRIKKTLKKTAAKVERERTFNALEKKKKRQS